MRNVTISMDEALVRLTEAEAAKAGKSLSDYISSVVSHEIEGRLQERDASNPQLEALKRAFAGPLLPLSENGRMPSSEDRNARR